MSGVKGTIQAMNGTSDTLSAVELCAGAGGQSLGLHRAGFEHAVAVEIDANAARTLALNSERLTPGGWRVEVGDVADTSVWNPADYHGVSLLAGGVPCPPFSIAGKQLGSADERDLFAWAVECAGVIQPRALMLENVRGLAATRFAGYRQRILDRLSELGYVGQWRLLQAADFGLAQLRPRFVMVALRPEDAPYFSWPSPTVSRFVTVGEELVDLMAADGWRHAAAWQELAAEVGPTIVGGSKKHGGADLGPTRAKQAWAKLAVDGRGIADAVPARSAPHPSERMPRLTMDMVARLQGWREEDEWEFTGGKTSRYRQIGNAFPAPLAEAIGARIAAAIRHEGAPRVTDIADDVHSPVYRALAGATVYQSLDELASAVNVTSGTRVERELHAIGQDFELETISDQGVLKYRLGGFKGFTGQADHSRHEFFDSRRHLVS